MGNPQLADGDSLPERMKWLATITVFCLLTSLVWGAAAAAGGTPITDSNQAIQQIKASNTMQNIDPATMQKPDVWNTAKADPKAMNTLDQGQMKSIEKNPEKMKDVAKNLQKDSLSAKNYPDTQEAADALKEKPDKVNELPKDKVNKFVKDGKLDQKVVDKLDLQKGQWNQEEIGDLKKNLAANNEKYKFTRNSEFIQQNRDVLFSNTATNNPSSTGPTTPTGGGGPPGGTQPQSTGGGAGSGDSGGPAGGGEGGAGGGEGAGSGGAGGGEGGGQGGGGAGGGEGGQQAGGQGGEGGQPGGQEGKGGDPSQMLSGLGGLLQGVAALMQAGKQDQKQDQQKDVNTPPETGKQIAACAIKCPRNACDQQVVTADTGVGTVCCETACKQLTATAQGQNAQQDIQQAKAADASQLAFKLSGTQGEKITSLDGSTKQDMTLLNQAADKVTPTDDKIFVTNGKATNLYTLKNTQRGVEDFYGIFILDRTGIQKISVGEEDGATTADPTGIFLWQLPGTTVYNANRDEYETDSYVYAAQYGLWIKATQHQGAGTPTGQFAHEFSFPTAGMTFGHGRLSDLLRNAIDASLAARGDVDVIIHAKGFQDVDLLGNIGFFPLFIRNLAKGSTRIIYERNVAVQKKYQIKDRQYEYKVLRETTTKVKAQNGKIIEDSGSIPLHKEALSSKQKRILYEG